MKQILVISGKGGTGKTVITASFAALSKNRVMADCDVDAADLHLLLHPEIKEKHNFEGGKTAVIDEKKCIGCGKCQEVCRFEAVKNKGNKFKIDSLACEGCGTCRLVCPEDAISLKTENAGYWFISETKYGALVHAKLGIAQENSGKLVSLVREKAVTIASEKGADYVIIDGPPGIGCPVIASISGVDLALIVIEPTLSGMHDAQRVINVAKHFGIKTAVCINKNDLNPKNSGIIRKDCLQSGIPILGEVPFDKIVPESLVQEKPIVEYNKNCKVSSEIRNTWNRITEILN